MDAISATLLVASVLLRESPAHPLSPARAELLRKLGALEGRSEAPGAPADDPAAAERSVA